MASPMTYATKRKDALPGAMRDLEMG